MNLSPSCCYFLSWVEVFSSALCSQTPSFCVLLMFRIHVKYQYDCSSYISFLRFLSGVEEDASEGKFRVGQ
jgi:hypothetical protein